MAPNVCITDGAALKEINYSYYIKTYNLDQKLEMYFSLCKLVLQARVYTEEHFTWLHLLKQRESSLVEEKSMFLDKYIEFSSAFAPFPIDVSSFIYIVQRIKCPLQKRMSNVTSTKKLLKLFDVLNTMNDLWETVDPSIINNDWIINYVFKSPTEMMEVSYNLYQNRKLIDKCQQFIDYLFM
ncbi:unnamed protein product [Didymodactylos carnosus]|uniref:Uncharacterized protein n=1 Tax=Didymodactylos carnosus TaxID=1234261 RepID=A0A814KV71_9BILA|nr:unnamed protein product [Didymodactylos carnosus]CAF1245168.1 unnamed protein product [Didymodactylos carnosus]CAF3825234.1 unnamed protein product [Didymodactylos carnosus]CAF4052689.1 unnamed protein product [Didymodactylos carnosus]